MASGTIAQKSSTNSKVLTRVLWSSTADTTTNKSVVTATVQIYYSGTYVWGTFAGSITIDGTSTSVSEYKNFTGEVWQTIGSASKTITHSDDGSKKITISSTLSQSGTSAAGTFTTSEEVTLDTIPRASTIADVSGNIGSSAKITITRASTSFKHTLKYSFSGLSGTIATDVTTSNTWTIPTTFYAKLTTDNSGTGTITCETYNGSVLVGTSTSKLTVNVTNSNPTFPTDNISYYDSNTTIVDITKNNQYIIKNLSNLKLNITSATGVNSATISKYNITFNGSTTSKTSSGVVDFGKINSSNKLDLVVEAVDSRGNSTKRTISVNCIDYDSPNATINLNRKNNYEDETTLKVQSSISYVSGINSISSTKYRYKKTSDSSYSNYIEINNNTEYTLTLDKQNVWNVQVVVNDLFDYSEYELLVAKGMPIMFIDVKKLSVGVNTFPTEEKSLEIDGNVIVNGKINIPIKDKYGIANAGLNLNNNDVAGLNTLYFQDECNSTLEGIMFPKSGVEANSEDNSDYDCFRGYQSKLYFGSNKVMVETLLYDNSSGSNVTITLNETTENFDFIEIHFRNNDNVYDSKRFHSPNGKRIGLLSINSAASYLYLKATELNVSGSTLTPLESNYGEVRIGNGVATTYGGTTNQTYITRVIGFR